MLGTAHPAQPSCMWVAVEWGQLESHCKWWDTFSWGQQWMEGLEHLQYQLLGTLRVSFVGRAVGAGGPLPLLPLSLQQGWDMGWHRVGGTLLYGTGRDEQGALSHPPFCLGLCAPCVQTATLGAPFALKGSRGL